MEVITIIITLLGFVNFGTAFDNFQGLGRLSKPCFSAFDHQECDKTLLESYDPPIKGASRNPATTFFFLFTPKSQSKAEQLQQCGGGLPPQSTFDATCPTEILIHVEIKEQLYLKSSCYNIILVDWTWGNFPDIASAPTDSKVVGQQVAFVLENIARQSNYDCRKFHITAHSYGVVAASYAGKLMQGECRLGRLTSLDAALPPFLEAPDEERLNPTDALLVDAIHTNGGNCFPFNIGDPRPLGHINFYVNDGMHQPSCYLYAGQSFLKLDFLYAIGSFIYPALCSHVQSIQYYKVSILADADDTQLIGVQCNSYEEWMSGKCERNCEIEGKCLPMGIDTPLYIDYRNLSTEAKERKIFYVPTTLSCPYSDHSGFTGLPLAPVMDKETPI